jgi:hypothetical protein
VCVLQESWFTRREGREGTIFRACILNAVRLKQKRFASASTMPEETRKTFHAESIKRASSTLILKKKQTVFFTKISGSRWILSFFSRGYSQRRSALSA